MNNYNQIRKQSWDRALHSFGTGHIFRRRVDKFRRLLRLLSFLGIVVPLLVGGVVLSFGAEFKCLNVVLILAGIAGIAQLVLSVWGLTANWQASYAYAVESSTANRRLSKQFETLGANPPDNVAELRMRYRLLEVEDQARRDLDNQHGVTSEEERAGMRVALRKFQRRCASCHKVPQSTLPTNCPVCGNFSKRLS